MEDSKGLTPWQRYKQNLGTTRPWDLLDPNANWASEEKASARMAICRDCPFFISLTTQCKKCGCIMSGKTKLEEAVCPEHKW